MKPYGLFCKSFVSCLLAITVTTVYSLSALAAPEPAQDSGTLTARGEVRVNGNPSQTGATIMTGSLITTGNNATAIIDLGAALGRIEIRENIAVTLNFSPAGVQLQADCSGELEVKVTRGQATATEANKSPKTIPAGEDEDFNDPVNVTTAGGTDLILSCGDDHKGGYIGPGLLGVLALAGLATAVVIGIAIGDEPDTPATDASPIRP